MSHQKSPEPRPFATGNAKGRHGLRQLGWNSFLLQAFQGACHFIPAGQGSAAGVGPEFTRTGFVPS